MLYALTLDDNYRIISTTYSKYASPNSHLVSELPEGDLYNYLYIDGKFIYSPIPETEVEDKHIPTPQDDIDSMLIDHEYRLTLLELGLNE